MTAQEAYEIIKKEFPGKVAYSCLEFEEFFGFLLTNNPDGEELLGVAYRTVNKDTGEIGLFYPTWDFKKYLASKKIDVKTLIHTDK